MSGDGIGDEFFNVHVISVLQAPNHNKTVIKSSKEHLLGVFVVKSQGLWLFYITVQIKEC